MKKKIKHIEECRKRFEIEVPSEEVTKRIADFYDRIGKFASVAGFRPGKVPRDLLQKHYQERATKEVVEDLISDAYREALEESGFAPLGLPQISDVKLDEARVLFFNVEFNVRPKIELRDYKGLKLTKKRIEIKEEDIEKSIKTLQEANAKFKDAPNRAVQMGDYIVCDSEILVDEKPISKKRENIWMPIEEKSPVPDLSSKLIGANIGEEREIETTLPEDFRDKKYANKKAIFKIKVKEIKERALLQIDDEFAKDLGYNNLPELREAVKKTLENQVEQKLRQDLENQALEGLLENSNFNVPSSLVEKQLGYLIQDQMDRLIKQGFKKEAIKEKEKDLTDKLRPLAIKQVKTMFLLNEISDREKIGVSKEEIDEAFEEIARYSNQPKEKVERYYKENDLASGLEADIRNRKVLEFLIKEANIIEESPSPPKIRS